jgi:hypothetical protein
VVRNEGSAAYFTDRGNLHAPFAEKSPLAEESPHYVAEAAWWARLTNLDLQEIRRSGERVKPVHRARGWIRSLMGLAESAEGADRAASERGRVSGK